MSKCEFMFPRCGGIGGQQRLHKENRTSEWLPQAQAYITFMTLFDRILVSLTDIFYVLFFPRMSSKGAGPLFSFWSLFYKLWENWAHTFWLKYLNSATLWLTEKQTEMCFGHVWNCDIFNFSGLVWSITFEKYVFDKQPCLFLKQWRSWYLFVRHIRKASSKSE